MRSLESMTYWQWLLVMVSFLSLGQVWASSYEIGDAYVNTSEDYSDLNGKDPTETPVDPVSRPGDPPEACYEDVCHDLPAPCAELAAQRQCSCPGVSLGPQAFPEMPVVKVYWREGRAPEVRWCAAHANKMSYRLLVHGQQVALFEELKRSSVVQSLEAGMEVCVVAVNDVGESKPEGVACDVYDPPKGSPTLTLWVGLIAGALGLVLLAGIVFLIWRAHLRKQRRRGTNTRTLA